MVKLYNKDTNEFLGRISEAQFAILAGHLELESLNDHDYYITRETLDLVEQSGADPTVVDLLRAAMKPREAIEIRWEKE